MNDKEKKNEIEPQEEPSSIPTLSSIIYAYLGYVSIGLCAVVVIITALMLFEVVDSAIANLINIILLVVITIINIVNLKKSDNKTYAMLSLFIGLIMLAIIVFEYVF